eukprot:jgi/Botrbrau1/3233/Bobra.174_1s0006.1
MRTEYVLCSRQIVPRDKPSQSVAWDYHEPIGKKIHWLSYVIGRDEFISHADLAAGFDARDRETGNHVLWCTHMPEGTVDSSAKLVLRVLEKCKDGSLPPATDGRVAAGPLDLNSFLRKNKEVCTCLCMHMATISLCSPSSPLVVRLQCFC